MKTAQGICYVCDDKGRTLAVQVPLDIWRQIEPLARSVLCGKPAVAETPEPIQAFDEFLQHWDFRYPYSPAVVCPVCNASTQDWRIGDARPFRLVNANFGGLLVFRCKQCDTTIRQKHFRDHVALEHSVHS
ncbi:MAG: hypothetical protein LBO64_08455 [Desulfovibrio sp.]|nr:hypothetical protein [Desulfovibrio sp.]